MRLKKKLNQRVISPCIVTRRTIIQNKVTYFRCPPHPVYTGCTLFSESYHIY